MFCALRSAPIALIFFAAAVSADQGDQMKGIGMPILFIVLLAVVVFFTRQYLLDAVQASRSNMNIAFSFGSAVITALMSVFLYFSAAYNYGLISTIIAYTNMCISSGSKSKQFMAPMLAVMVAWFCFLVGIPDGLSNGIINAVSSTNCKSFYPNYSDTMCKDGWIVFLLICSCILIGLTLMSLLSVMNLAISDETPAYARVGGQDGIAAPLRQNEYSPPTSDYQKVSPA